MDPMIHKYNTSNVIIGARALAAPRSLRLCPYLLLSASQAAEYSAVTRSLDLVKLLPSWSDNNVRALLLRNSNKGFSYDACRMKHAVSICYKVSIFLTKQTNSTPTSTDSHFHRVYKRLFKMRILR